MSANRFEVAPTIEVATASAPDEGRVSALLDSPRKLAEIRLFFSKPSKRDLRAARRILGPLLITGEQTTDGTVAISIRPPSILKVPREVMVGMRATFGHLKSFDRCDMMFDAPVAPPEVSA